MKTHPALRCSPPLKLARFAFLAAAFAVAGLPALRPAPVATAAKAFDLPADIGDKSLSRFAVQAGVEVVFGSATAAQVRTNAVKGTYDAREALDLLLANTGLVVVRDEKTGALTVSRDPNAVRAAPAPEGRRPESPAGDVSSETVVLSPFQVDASAEKGYLATQTLSGTRLKSDIKDLGSALTIFTEQMMDDLGATSVQDLFTFSPNTDAFVTTLADTSGRGLEFINNGTQYVTRGGRTEVVGQDFFSNNVAGDRYNSEAFTFSRGPNAILFGLGNPTGAFMSSTKRARNRTATTIEAKADDRDSLRTTLDHNQVILKDRLAIRYAGVYEKAIGFRIPSESFQRRHFVTTQFTPFRKTTLRLNYERGFLKSPALRPWPVNDAVTPWLDAGSPLLATFSAPRPRGTVDYTNNALVSTEFSPAGTPIPTQVLRNGGVSQTANYASGYPDSGGLRSLVNPAVFPTLASAHGKASYRQTDFRVTTVFLEQEITRNFFVEAALNRNVAELWSVNGFVGGQETLFVDVNRQLPNGSPNPNVGRLYTESQARLIKIPSRSESQRLMASYDLNLTTRSASWLRHLGRQRAAVFLEGVDRSQYNSGLGTFNTTPLATTGAAATTITNAANQIWYRYYYDPASGRVGNYGGQFAALPVIWSDTPLPARQASGVTPAYVTTSGPSALQSAVATRAGVLQSTFLKDRIVLTNGWREDVQRAWRAVAADFPANARGIWPDPTGYDLRAYVPGSRRERGGHTYTQGLVVRPIGWLGLTYNRSNNLQINDSTPNVYGNVLPNPHGKGSDWGLKLASPDQRYYFELTYYTNATQDKIENLQSTVAGDFKNNLDRIWEAVADTTADPKYRVAPYSNLGSVGWQDSATTSTSGWEFSATANPTSRWRVSVNGSRRSTATTTARGVYIRQYLAEYMPVLKTPQWQSLPTTAELTVADRVAALEKTLANLGVIQDLPEDVYAPRWTLNLIQTYAFAPSSRLAGISIGGSMNARGSTVDGFEENVSRVVVPSRPYHAPSYELFGAWVTYQRKLFEKRIDWRLQLNVRNLFDGYTVFPLRDVDARDGSHRRVTAVYRLNEPRTFTLTSAFKF